MVNLMSQAHILLDHEVRSQRPIASMTFHTGVPQLDNDLPSLLTTNHVHCIGTHPVKLLSLEIATSYLQNVTQSNIDGKLFIIAPPEQAASTIQRIHSMLKTKLTEQKAMRRLGTTASEKKKPSDAKSLLEKVSLMQYLDMTGLIESIDEASNSSRGGIVLVLGLTSLTSNMQRSIGLGQTAAAVTVMFRKLRSSGNTFVHVVEFEIGWTNVVADSQSHMTSGQSRSAGLVTAFASEPTRILRMNTSPVMERVMLEGFDVVTALHDGDGKLNDNLSSVIVEVVKDERLLADCAVGKWALWT